MRNMCLADELDDFSADDVAVRHLRWATRRFDRLTWAMTALLSSKLLHHIENINFNGHVDSKNCVSATDVPVSNLKEIRERVMANEQYNLNTGEGSMKAIRVYVR